MNLIKILSTSVDSLKRRIVKFTRFGLNDVQTSLQASPYGFDSNPIKDVIAVYSPTTDKGSTVILGYINKNQLAEIGENRLFSTDENGIQKFYVWLKNDGTIEIGGNTNNIVNYTPLNTALQTYLTELNAAITAGISSAGGAYTPPSSLDISASKNTEIKTL